MMSIFGLDLRCRNHVIDLDFVNVPLIFHRQFGVKPRGLATVECDSRLIESYNYYR